MITAGSVEESKPSPFIIGVGAVAKHLVVSGSGIKNTQKRFKQGLNLFVSSSWFSFFPMGPEHSSISITDFCDHLRYLLANPNAPNAQNEASKTTGELDAFFSKKSQDSKP